MASRTNRVLTDRKEIRRWAEERNARPACVRGTGGKNDIGMLRLDFPGHSGAQSLEPIDWNEWFDKFDENGLALLVQDRTARGERSNFNKIVSRETARAAKGGRPRAKASGRRPADRKSAAKRAPRRTAAKSTSRRKRTSTARSSRKKSASSRASSARISRKTRSAGANRGRSTATKSAASRGRANSSRSTSSRKMQRSSASPRRRAASRNNVRSIESGRRSSKSHVLTDHDEIRRWAKERKAAPACVRGTGGGKDPGMVRLDFPGFSGARSLERIDWDKWFRAFDDNNLALVVQDSRVGGGRSNFNKLVARETVENGKGSRTRASAGNPGSKRATRGSTRSRRTESVRGRSTSHKRAA